MTVRRFAAAAVLALATIGVAVPAGHAAIPTCNGLEATVVGTDGPDHLVGTDGPDVVVLGSGNDDFSGGKGDDVICGGIGNDALSGSTGDDAVFGEDGDDVIREAAGDDRINGGSGTDRLFYNQFGGLDLRLDARIGKATSTNGTDIFGGFESYVGSPNSDTLIGSRIDERIDSLAGKNDVVHGLGGDDEITNSSYKNTVFVVDAGDGDDVVRVFSKTARVRLGAGDDRLRYYVTGWDGTWFDGGPGVDGFIATAGGSGFQINLDGRYLAPIVAPQIRIALGGFENATGSYGRDRIIGTAGPNRLNGGYGDDTVLGLGGADSLFAGPTSDYDVADGGTGADSCTGFDSKISC